MAAETASCNETDGAREQESKRAREQLDDHLVPPKLSPDNSNLLWSLVFQQFQLHHLLQAFLLAGFQGPGGLGVEDTMKSLYLGLVLELYLGRARYNCNKYNLLAQTVPWGWRAG